MAAAVVQDMDITAEIVMAAVVIANVALDQEARVGLVVLRANRVNKAQGDTAELKARADHEDFWARKDRRAIPAQ